MHIIVLGIDMN